MFVNRFMPQSLALAGTLSLYGGTALAQGPQPSPLEVPQGRAGTATLCIEMRSRVNPQTKKIETPEIYLHEMPKDGISTGYLKGNDLAKKWEALFNPTDEAMKEWLDGTDGDLRNQFDDAIEVLKRLDKNPVDGTVTYDEFQQGEKGRPEKEQRTDLGLLAALRCSGLYLTEGALNTIKLDEFPEVATLKKDAGKAKKAIGELQGSLAATQDELEKAQISITSLKNDLEIKSKNIESAHNTIKGYYYAAAALTIAALLLGGILGASRTRKKLEEAHQAQLRKLAFPPVPRKDEDKGEDDDGFDLDNFSDAPTKPQTAVPPPLPKPKRNP